MIIASLLALASAQGDPVARQDAPTPGAIDWDSLPALPYREPPTMTPAMHDWARGQVRARKCRAGRLVDGRPAVRVEVAVLVDEDGVRTTVPRAIGCPTIEQYAAGLVAGFSRNNVPQRAAAPGAWYRATVTFAWRQ
ncbi:MAG: hypothetical protein ACK4GG_06570 [Sphingomonas sp.]